MSHSRLFRSFLVALVVASVAGIGTSGHLVLAQTASKTKAAEAAQKTTPPAPASKAEAADAATEDSSLREPTPLEKDILAATEKLVGAFNEGKIEQLLDTFLPEGELIDEQGTIHEGHAAIATLAKAFFEAYPEARTELELESVRQIGDLVLADGSRVIITKAGDGVTPLRFTAVWKKADNGYKLASFRDFSLDVPPTPHEALQSVEWIIGEWVNEGSDAKVELTFRWSEDENYILGDIIVKNGSAVMAKSVQRIGWDANEGVLRSWTFDSDGGFGESRWEQGEAEWVLQSAATSPDGSQGSATMTIAPVDKNRFQIRVTNRMAGSIEEPEFEYKVVRKPPTASRK